LSSPSFRKLHLPAAKMKTAMLWLKKPETGYLVLGEILRSDLDGRVITVAGLLELILERERARMAEFGLEVTELDLWYS